MNAVSPTTQGRIERIDRTYLPPVRSGAHRDSPVTERLIAPIRKTWPSPHDAIQQAAEEGFTGAAGTAYAGAWTP